MINMPSEDNLININTLVFEKIFYIKKDKKIKDISLPQNQSTKNNSLKTINNNLLNKKRKYPTKNMLNTDNGNIKDNKSKFGRKHKSEKGERKHNKYSIDNIMIKIKGMLFNFIRDLIKQLSNNEYDLKKFKYNFHSDLKKDKNEIYLEEKLGNIFKRLPISTKYTNFKSEENKKIITKIYKDKDKNKILINILELKFEEGLILFRRKYEKDKIKIKEILNKTGLATINDNKKYKDAEYCIEYLSKMYKDKDVKYNEYINDFKTSLLKFKYLFNKKIGRTSKKDIKNNKK